MQEPLFFSLGLGTTLSCDEILNNTFNPPDELEQYTTELLNCLTKHPNAPQTYNTVITKEVFQEGWRKMKQRTSAGISGTCTFWSNESMCTVSSAFEAFIANVSYTRGTPSLARGKGVNVMINKKLYNDLVTKLRTIVLTEADSNFNNEVLGKSIIHQVETFHLLLDEQYGNRQNK